MIQRPSPSGGPFAFDPAALDPARHRRIMVTGANGAGKTHLARALAAATGAPLLHKDAAALLTGWRQRSGAEVRTIVDAHVRQPAWVLDTGPTSLRPDVLDRTDLVIWLDPPAWLRVWRIARRSVRYLGRSRPEHPSGNRDWPGRRQAAFLWRAWAERHAFDRAIGQALAAWPGPVWRLTRAAEAEALLGALQAAGQRAERL